MTEGRDQRSASGSVEPMARREVSLRPMGTYALVGRQKSEISVALLTGGKDRHYAVGVATALAAEGLSIDFIAGDDLKVPELVNNPGVNFLNLRGDQRPGASSAAKVLRVLKYYVNLILYAATARPRLLHILWNNKFELFDRTLLMLYYKALGKRVVFTAHNVNAGKRDSNDTWLNRFSLKVQYALTDHILVHTERMKSELVADFNVFGQKVSVIPYGINNAVPNSALSTMEAKGQLGVNSSDKVILFFGNIAPYKGLEYLVAALTELLKSEPTYLALIVGNPKGPEGYWKRIQQTIARSCIRDRIIQIIEYVPDEATELYFKAADVLILPYTHIFQSGVLFLGYSFGLPAIAADVGSLKEEIIDGKTGFVFKPRDSSDLVRVIGKYFDSELFRNLENRRAEIKAYANERCSWENVAKITTHVYAELLRRTGVGDQRSEVRPSSTHT